MTRLIYARGLVDAEKMEYNLTVAGLPSKAKAEEFANKLAPHIAAVITEVMGKPPAEVGVNLGADPDVAKAIGEASNAPVTSVGGLSETLRKFGMDEMAEAAEGCQCESCVKRREAEAREAAKHGHA